MPTVLSYNPKELELDGDWRADDIVYALEHISWTSNTVTVRIDKDLAQYLAAALRRSHAARATR
jgi:hypothetical protein